MAARDYVGADALPGELRNTLAGYIEASYHIRDVSLIRERAELLLQEGAISQRPWLEATPSYKAGKSFRDLDLPGPAAELLSSVANIRDTGIYPIPYHHQSEALYAFLTQGKDLVIAAGTGSGKTESFLMPILGTMAQEAADRTQSARRHGCRAMLLYPMNALVNDQLGRVRKLFGNEEVARLLAEGRDRLVRFGSYTSRTPYPGVRSNAKDQQHIGELFDGFYMKIAADKELRVKLVDRGRWPAKDLKGFYGVDAQRKNMYKTGYRKGQTYIEQHWEQRLRTQPGDRELLTRHEMQRECPDLLITNYSMLEYMLMRPIERDIFRQTREWLASDYRNQFILILDEAHLYRGSSGAEVGLLIRRLQARLGISRSRMRCILTSASLGGGEKAEEATIKFAQDLTGEPENGFRLIVGELEERSGSRPGTLTETAVLSRFDAPGLHQALTNPKSGFEAVEAVAHDLGWTEPRPAEPLSHYLYDRLTGFGPAEYLVEACRGVPQEWHSLAGSVFPDVQHETSTRALNALVALCSFAKRASDERSLVPLRLHMFFRGLPALHACINVECDARLDQDEGSHVLGRLYTAPRLHCSCSGRVFELLTHRQCGAAFLRAYVRSIEDGFLLNERGANLGLNGVYDLPPREIHLLVDGPPNDRALSACAQVWIDTLTGKISTSAPKRSNGFLKAFIPATEDGGDPRVISFARCPVCLRRLTPSNGIMDLATKGEAPFAQLVRDQLMAQPPVNEESLDRPNGGRKVLLFSDGRQKAARLARDIPRAAELDSFRQAIVLAATKVGQPCRLTSKLYVALLSVVHTHNLQLFDGEDRSRLLGDVADFVRWFNGDLQAAVQEDWDVTPPRRYEAALLRQLCEPHYSLSTLTIGYVVPSNLALVHRELNSVMKLAPENSAAICQAFIAAALGYWAFDAEIEEGVREHAAGYPIRSWNGRFPRTVNTILQEEFQASEDQIANLRAVLQRVLCGRKGDAWFLNRNRIALKVALADSWFHCKSCSNVSPVTLAGKCMTCGTTGPDLLHPDENPYLRARKEYWRDPVVGVLDGTVRLTSLAVEEHTAQLGYRDRGVAFSTTEMYELRFQDLVLDADDGPIDMLSCTTTMEVGVDIGSLVAVGLRNVPPQRENYQQRAGRAGRRGSAVSTVLTYAQEGPHDSHYFHHPREVIAGPVRPPMVNVDNERIARRHVHSYLLQTFFHEAIELGRIEPSSNAALFASLGTASDFFSSQGPVSLAAFEIWIGERVLAKGVVARDIESWMPPKILEGSPDWVHNVAAGLVDQLQEMARLYVPPSPGTPGSDDEFLGYLFDHGLLPSYAFPVYLSSFSVEERGSVGRVRIVQRPQQEMNKALSEYAPGRLIVIDKRTYRSGGVAADTVLTEPDRAKALFDKQRRYASCTRCTFVQDPSDPSDPPLRCPVCNGPTSVASMIVPEVYYPEDGKALVDSDRSQDITYATSAQLPIPAAENELKGWKWAGANLESTYAVNQTLVMVNRGIDGDGFRVCELCGSTVGDTGGSHRRPYPVADLPGRRMTSTCRGAFRSVFLGHIFRSDVLLLRSRLRPPVISELSHGISLSALNDAMQTVAEALLLATSRGLDIDPSELSPGIRQVLGDEGGLRADIYLYDTLSGGAGYAEQASLVLPAILESTLRTLDECPEACETSCYQCLRHYQNQFHHARLNRKLGAALLRYMLNGTVPANPSVASQARQLAPLRRLLDLRGMACETEVLVNGVLVPLLVRQGFHSVAVGVYPSLLDRQADEFSHSLMDLKGELPLILVPDLVPDRNLPALYSQVANALGAP